MKNYMMDKNLSPAAKQVLSVIINDADNNNETLINNQQIANMLDKTTVTVSNAVTTLKANGYILVEPIHRGRRIKLV